MRFLVAVLLRLFPAPFRRRFGPDLLAAFDDRWRERPGWRLAARTVADLLRSAMLERLRWPATQAVSKGDGFLHGIGGDVRLAARGLLLSPGFALAALATLALGIGATAGIYSVVDAVLFKGLPYPHAERLVFLNERLPQAQLLNVSWPDFTDWRSQNRVFTEVAAFQANQINVVTPEGPGSVKVAWASSSLFSLLGAKTIAGRTFGEEDDRPGAAPVAVLSYQLWRAQFKGDLNLAGKQIQTAAGAFSVAGVLAPDFQFEPWDFALYLPLGLRSKNPDFTNRANHPGLQVVAGMRLGISLARVRADMQTLMDRLARQFPESNRNETAVVAPMADRLVGSVRTELLMLLGAVLFVLLIACANVAHLALARAAGRRREFAIRAAIGASRGRLTRQVLVESSLLSFAGGGLGLLLAWWSVPLLTRMYPQPVPGLKEAHLDVSVLMFTFAVCGFAALLFGMAPMFQAGRARFQEIQEGSAGKHGRRMRSGLFVTEIAVAIVVTVGAGLLLRSLAAVLDVNPGFRADHLLALDVVRSGGAPEGSLRFFDQAADAVAHLPGVRSASAAMSPPLSGTFWTSPYFPEGQAAPPVNERQWTAINPVTPGYFRTVEARLLEGRLFDRNDDSHSTRVAIVNETLARRLGPRGQAVGKRIHVLYAPGELLQVTGVIADIKQFGLDLPASAEVFVPAAQSPMGFMTIVARTSSDPAALAKPAEGAIHRLDRSQAISRVTPLTQTIASSVSRRRFAASLLGLFSALALLLAGVGVSGVMAYTVAQRSREFGIRVAIGARSGQVLRQVLREGFRLTTAGVALGLAAAWALARFLTSMLYGVKPHDALTFTAVAALLAGVAMAACLLPARRAARVDPMRVLRCD